MESRCNNSIRFNAEPQMLKEIEWLFQAMSALEKENGLGQIPPFIDDDGEGYLFEIDFSKGCFYYETKSEPNIEVLVKIADRFRAGFLLEYYDFGHALFGEAKYEYGTLTDVRLDVEDFEQFNYDLEEQAYMFEGFYYDSEAEILEIMLEMKKNQLNNSYGNRR